MCSKLSLPDYINIHYSGPRSILETLELTQPVSWKEFAIIVSKSIENTEIMKTNDDQSTKMTVFDHLSGRPLPPQRGLCVKNFSEI